MVSRKLALGSLFHTKAKDTASPSTPPSDPGAAAPAWAWPSCKHPRTQSFHHAGPPPPGAPRTLASIFLGSAESSFTSSSARQHEDDCSADDSLSTTASEASAAAGDDGAIVVGGLRIRSSDRILFDPAAGASATSSILEEKPVVDARARARARGHEVFVGGLAVAFESANPYRDFRASMEEMLDAAHGVGAGFLGWGWGWLEEMLGWYLRANGEDTHGAIVAAFIDVIVAIADRQARSACSSRSSSCTSSVDRELEEVAR